MRERQANDQFLLDPVLAYDRVAPCFEALSDLRRTYLTSVEQLVSSEIPRGSRSLLDVGAGNGTRAVRIAQATGVKNLSLLEPSTGMRRDWPTEVRRWPVRAEQLSGKTGTFDVILCLWNVLGHIFPSRSRTDVLRHCGRLLSPEGRIFIDVINRYNAAQYGVFRTALRMLRDRVRPNENNGNVIVHWQVNGKTHTTKGHVFTPSEFLKMAQSAELAIEKQFTIHYSTGQICRSRFRGNPLYILRRA